MDTLINISLALLMFAIGTNTNFHDFKKQLKQKQTIIIGITMQLVLPLIVAILMINIFDLSGLYAMGVILMAAVPGGSTSAIITHRTKGDTALSITLTSINSIIISLITLPLIITYAFNHFVGSEIVGEINNIKMMIQLFALVTVPVMLSLITKARVTKQTATLITKRANRYIIGYYIIMIVVGIVMIVNNTDLLKESRGTLTLVALSTNLILLLLGYNIAQRCKFNNKTSKTIAIETAFQNNNLALALAIAILNSEIIGIPSLFYGVIMTITGLLLAYIVAPKTKPSIKFTSYNKQEKKIGNI